jgi:hypothetical protein
MALGDGIRRDVAKISPDERRRLLDAFVGLTHKLFPGERDDEPLAGGVSFWFKQDEIHQATHVHGGPSFLPWHRELCNRLEAMLRLVDPAVSLHYWDWTTDPQPSLDGTGGRANLFTSSFMGSANGPARLAGFDNDGKLTGSRNETRNAADPPQEIARNIRLGAPAPANGVPNFKSDAAMVTSGDMLPPNRQYQAFRRALEDMHNDIHRNYIRGTIGPGHSSFEDPFVFLLHSNVDRLFAMWQLAPGHTERLTPDVYGDEGDSTGRDGIMTLMEPWAGNAMNDRAVLRVRPWAPPEDEHVLEKNRKNCKHWSIVQPPLYDSSVYSFISLRSFLIGKGLDPASGISAPMEEANLTSVLAFVAS